MSASWEQNVSGDSVPRLQFGLGKHQAEVDVEVQWPSGILTHLKGIKPRQLLVIEEKE